MSALRPVLKSIKKTEIVWRYLSNLRPTVGYRAARGERLTSIEQGLVEQLDNDGIAITSIDSLVDALQLNEVHKSVAELLKRKVTDIEQLSVDAVNEDTIGNKTFNLEMLSSEVTFGAQDCFARFALNDSFLRISNAYFGMFSQLRYYNVWYTAASNSTARESQLWHFDREDNYILKVFLYLDDVEEGAGPFTYAPGTHRKGKYRNIRPEYFLEGGVRRTTDDQMKAAYPGDKWIRAIGKKGTIVFADTRGYHKGGEARTKDRLMFTCMYTSPASESKRLIKFPDDFDPSALSKKQLQALQWK